MGATGSATVGVGAGFAANTAGETGGNSMRSCRCMTICTTIFLSSLHPNQVLISTTCGTGLSSASEVQRETNQSQCIAQHRP